MTNSRLSRQDAAQALQRRRHARRSLQGFTEYTFPTYRAEPFHKLLCETLDQVVAGKIDRLMLFSPPQHGKLIAHDVPVLTAEGWRQHGDLRPGDFVFDRQGQLTGVIAISVDGMADREIEFTDGGKIQCHAAHEWVIVARDKRWQGESVLETDQMADAGIWIGPRGKRGGRARFQVDANVCTKFPLAELPIPPYVLGAWLGDGSADKNCVTHHPKDIAIIDRIESLGYERTGVSVHKRTGVHTSYFRRLYGALMSMGLMGHKHIPEQYLCSSTEQRLELLAGLIDTDGYVYHTNGRVTFSSADPELVDGTSDLVRSLGWRATASWFAPQTSSSGIVGKKPVCQVTFNPDMTIPTVLKRKRDHKPSPAVRRRGIKHIRRIKPRAGRCIQVEGGVYLAGKQLIPTHNSELASIRLPAYWLGKRPDDPIILTSYAGSLAHSNSRQARNVVESQEFARLFPGITTDQDARAVAQWEIGNYRGVLVAAGVGGPITGHGAMLGIIDDPFQNWEQAASEAYSDRVWDWWRTTFVTRVWEGGAIVLIMTRWHEDDLAGRLLREPDAASWTVLRLPALAETQKVRDDNNNYLGLPIGQADPLGREPQEPLSPLRFSKEALLRIQGSIGSMAWASLYQGVPRPVEGGLLKRAWFQKVKTWPQMVPVRVRYWDKAGTEGGGAYTAGVRLSIGHDLRVTIENVRRGQWATHERRRIMLETAEADRALFGNTVVIVVEQEPGSGGKDSAVDDVRMLAGFPAFADRPTGKKIVRLQPLAAQAGIGNVYMVEGPWNEDFVDELAAAPNNAFWDQCDAAGAAYSRAMEILMTQTPEVIEMSQRVHISPY